MSKKNAVRRNRALLKIRKAQHVDPEIKLAIEVILDLMNSKSDYNVAWPSAKFIAKRLRRSRRTGQWYVKTIKELGIFQCEQLPPRDAIAFCESRFGFRPNFDHCIKYGPNLYIVNPERPLWNKQKTLPDSVDREMGEVIRKIKAIRNRKTTSRLASDPTKHPRRQADSNPNRVYCLETMRERLRKTLDVLCNDDANELILRYEEEQRWCREEAWNDDVRDIINGDANDAQGFRLSFLEADDLIASPSEKQMISSLLPPKVSKFLSQTLR